MIGEWHVHPSYNGGVFPWEFVHDDYDGAPDAIDGRCGSGKTMEDCVEQIIEMETESAWAEGYLSGYIRS